jgi:hypothetical protein
MTKGAAKKGAGAARVPEYELLIRGGINSADERIDAELKSPALDRAMYPTGVVAVEINTDVGKKPHPHAVLDAFHVGSLIEFVRGQARIREALERALVRDRAEWDPDAPKLKKPDQIWSSAKVQSLELRRRQEVTAELEAHFRHLLPPKAAEAELAAHGDDAATRTVFTVVLECDWDDEHSVRASFRNGKFVDLDHQ